MPITTCIFDAYGTLFDVASAARELSDRPGHEDFAKHAAKLSNDWRLKQLQYTWLRAITGAHTDFWQVTQDGLDYALEASGLSGDEVLRETLLALYWELQAYPEVPKVLADLKKQGKSVAILSNGSPAMLEGAVDRAELNDLLDDVLSVESVGVFKPHSSVYESPAMLEGAVDRAELNDLLDDVLSVESVGVFKPHSSVYELVGKTFGCTPKEVLFVSSNGWDAAGAAGFGFQTVWVNRAGEPMDRLPWTPQTVVPDLTPVPELANTL
jgi:2-haloacid dehalogenase